MSNLEWFLLGTYYRPRAKRLTRYMAEFTTLLVD